MDDRIFVDTILETKNIRTANFPLSNSLEFYNILFYN